MNSSPPPSSQSNSPPPTSGNSPRAASPAPLPSGVPPETKIETPSVGKGNSKGNSAPTDECPPSKDFECRVEGLTVCLGKGKSSLLKNCMGLNSSSLFSPCWVLLIFCFAVKTLHVFASTTIKVDFKNCSLFLFLLVSY